MVRRNTVPLVPRSRPQRRLRGVLGGALVALGVAFAALLLVPGLLGYERYVIVGGSMSGTIDRGSLVFDRVVPVEDLRVGDVITYAPPQRMGPSPLVTHRIVAIETGADGQRFFRTKGDANPAEDPWPFVLQSATQARVDFHVPYAGYVLSFLSERRTRMLLIGLPALLIAFSVLAGLWRDAGAHTEPLPAAA
jgi:signal peptidase I